MPKKKDVLIETPVSREARSVVHAARIIFFELTVSLGSSLKPKCIPSICIPTNTIFQARTSMERRDSFRHSYRL